MLCCCFCNQKTVYELRISDWSSDVCSPDLLVEQVAGAVPRLGQRRRPIGEGRRLPALALLIKVEQRPQRDPAVDDIFAVVAGIVPAAGDVVAARAAGPMIALLVGARHAGDDLGRMPRRSRPAIAARITRLDRRARARLVEIIERRALEIGRASCRERVCQYG